MRSGLAFLAAANAAFMAGAAHAQDDDAALGSVYVRAGAGYTFVNNWDQDFTYNPDAVFVTPPPTGQTIENGDGVIFTGALGFDYADGIRTELEYRYAATKFDSVTLQDPMLGPVAAVTANDDIKVMCNAQIFETNLRGDTMWAARNEYTLRRIDGALRGPLSRITARDLFSIDRWR